MEGRVWVGRSTVFGRGNAAEGGRHRQAAGTGLRRWGPGGGCDGGQECGRAAVKACAAADSAIAATPGAAGIAV